MSVRTALKTLGMLALAALMGANTVRAGDCCCPLPIGCPKFVHCQPQPPCLKFPCVCGKPVCDPCTLENYGYFPTCWAQWTMPPNYACCPTTPPAMLVPPGTGHTPIGPWHGDENLSPYNPTPHSPPER
jgi:hypothetical protein